MPRIRITALSDRVNLPVEVKREFLGLELPVAKVPADQKRLLLAEDFQGPKTDQPEAPKSVYYVEVSEVLKALKKKSPDAAAWIEENTIENVCTGWFGFAKEECILIG